MRPIEIIGAGLAGLALGNALRRDEIPVTLYEAGTLPRHRVCGEFICGRGGDALHALGLGHTLRDAAQHRSTLWTVHGRKTLQHDLPSPALGISRFTLDRRLVENFREANGQLHTDTRRKSTAPQAGVAHCHGRQAAKSDWIGLKVHCQNLTTEADLELHLGDGGYVGLSRIEGGRVNVCALFRKRPDLSAKRADWLLTYLKASGLGPVAERVASGGPLPDTHCGVAGIEFARIPDTSTNHLALGDAYSVIPPFTGNGMSIALEAAELAYPFVRQYAQGEASWEATLRRVNQAQQKTFTRRLRAARWMHPWLHARARQQILAHVARSGCLPFNWLYSLTH